MPRPIPASELDAVVAAVTNSSQPSSLEDIIRQLPQTFARRTLQRRLAQLVANGRITARSSRAGRRYHLNSKTPGPPSSPHVFWLFGLSGSGKSTLGTLLANQLREKGRAVLSLDGDALRAGMCRGLGFTDADRAENLRRAAETARLGLQSQLSVVASFITPLESHRQLVAEVIGPNQVSFIYLSASLETCRSRDIKGLYAGAKTGTVGHMTGITSGFEPPARADLILDTGKADVATCSSQLLAFTHQFFPAATSPATV